MRLALTVCVVTAGVVALWMQANRNRRLDRLYEEQRWLEFRDAMVSRATPPGSFYRGALAYAFLDWRAAEGEFQPLIAAPATSGQVTLSQTIQSAVWLFKMYYLRGQYHRAWEQLERVSRMSRTSLTPNRSLMETEHFREECEVLRQYPDQDVTEREYSRILYTEVGNALSIPLTVDGKPAEYSIDTGAGPSYLSEKEAKRIGLTVHPANVEVNSATTVGVAVAKELVIGKFHLRNVTFEIFRDEDLSGDEGVIGLPVLLAFETLRWGSDGMLELGFPPAPANVRESNLFFDDHFLVADGMFRNRHLRLLLDTGGYETHLQPRFAREFAGVAAGPKEKFSFGEIGATVERNAVALPQLGLRVGGFDAVLLAGHHVLLEEWDDSDASRHGELGMDVLGQASSVTLDLRAMRLTLEGGGWQPAGGKNCTLPPAFWCRPGWSCTVKSDAKLKCFVDRVRAGDEDDEVDEDTSVCPLPAGFRCLTGSNCTAVFQDGGKCKVEQVRR